MTLDDLRALEAAAKDALGRCHRCAFLRQEHRDDMVHAPDHRMAVSPDTMLALLAIAEALPEDPWEEVSELDSDQRHICRWCGGRKPQHNDDCRWLAASTALATLEDR